MRVLILDEFYRDPPRDGGARAIHDLWRSALELGHEVHVHGDLPDLAARAEPWDLTIVSRPVLAARVAQAVRAVTRGPVLYLGHDLHHRRLAQVGSTLEGGPRPVAAMHALERLCWRGYDMSLYPNPAEVAEVVSTGSVARWFPYFRVDDIASDPVAPGNPSTGYLLFVGGSQHTPNLTGLRWFAEEVLRPLGGEAPRVVVVGRWESTLRDGFGPGIEFLGPVADASLADLRREALANIAPLVAGAGLKSKVIEALASGTPLITTPIGLQGIDSEDEVALVAADPQAWRRAIADVRAGAAHVDSAVRAALAYVREHHSRDAYLASLQDLLESTSAQRGRSPAGGYAAPVRTRSADG